MANLTQFGAHLVNPKLRCCMASPKSSVQFQVPSFELFELQVDLLGGNCGIARDFLFTHLVGCMQGGNVFPQLFEH